MTKLKRTGPSEVPQRVVDRVLAHAFATEAGCLESKYSVGSHGYAQVGWQEGGERVVTLCHRVIWMAEHGPIPAGMTVDHTCKNRKCVNFIHLRLLSNFENARRTFGDDWKLGFCKHGHPNTELVSRWNNTFKRYVQRCGVCERNWKARSNVKRYRPA